MEKYTFISGSEAQTLQFGKALAEKLLPGAILLLEGDLGAGKSVLARGIINSLGYKGAVTSPTFTIMNEYRINPPVYHFDMYRLEEPEQLYDIGYEEYLYSDGISIIEWPSKMEYLYPEYYIMVNIEHVSATERKITVSSNNDDMVKE